VCVCVCAFSGWGVGWGWDLESKKKKDIKETKCVACTGRKDDILAINIAQLSSAVQFL